METVWRRPGPISGSSELCGRGFVVLWRRALACVLSMNDKQLEQHVRTVAETALAERGFVTAIDVFLGLG